MKEEGVLFLFLFTHSCVCPFIPSFMQQISSEHSLWARSVWTTAFYKSKHFVNLKCLENSCHSKLFAEPRSLVLKEEGVWE